VGGRALWQRQVIAAAEFAIRHGGKGRGLWVGGVEVEQQGAWQMTMTSLGENWSREPIGRTTHSLLSLVAYHGFTDSLSLSVSLSPPLSLSPSLFMHTEHGSHRIALTARQHNSTTARQHGSTTARRHDSMTDSMDSRLTEKGAAGPLANVTCCRRSPASLDTLFVDRHSAGR